MRSHSVTTIDPETDDLRPANEIIRARLGKRVSQSTIWRWRARGVNGARLECVRAGGIWCTTAAAFGRFIAEQTRHANGGADAT